MEGNGQKKNQWRLEDKTRQMNKRPDRNRTSHSMSRVLRAGRCVFI